jgi:hypothetical protein
MYYLKIYQVIDGADNWPLIDTIEAETEQECIDEAERMYNSDNYHWCNAGCKIDALQCSNYNN